MRRIPILFSLVLLILNGCRSTNLLFTPVEGGPNGSVFTMVEFNNELYIGGGFDSVGGNKSKFIAKWNGEEWASVGEGLDKGYRGVEALCVYNGELYASGDFERINDTTQVEHIAKWNGNEWTKVGNGKSSGTHPYINTMCVHKNELYAAGLYDSVGGIQAKNIARWNGENWSNVGSGVDFTLTTLTVYNNELYAGGIGEDKAEGITKWNGYEWTQLGKSISPYFALQSYTEYEQKLIIAGTSFDSAGLSRFPKIVKWNGRTLEPFGVSFEDEDASLVTMQVYENELYIGGSIKFLDEKVKSKIIKWNEKEWISLATDTSGYVSCFANYRGELFAGGTFRNLNGKQIRFLTKINTRK